jgi:hypothetical protein
MSVFLPLLEALIADAAHFIFRTSEMRIVLPILFLRRSNDPIIMLRVLIIILGRDRIAGGLRVARKLNVFLCNVRRVAANFDIRAVRFIHARHGIVVAFAMIVAPAHPFVLTVSHDLPAANPFVLAANSTLVRSPA